MCLIAECMSRYYAMSGTHYAMPATCYAISSTHHAMSGTSCDVCATRSRVLSDAAYCDKVLEDREMPTPALLDGVAGFLGGGRNPMDDAGKFRYVPTRVLCDARYRDAAWCYVPTPFLGEGRY
eukprot:2642081-Rhodomonas_salina.4